MIALITFLAQPSLLRSLTGTQFNTNSTLIKISATTFYWSGSAARGPQTWSLLWRSTHSTLNPKLGSNCPCNIKIDWCMDQNGLTDSQKFPPFSGTMTTGARNGHTQVAFNTNRWRFLEEMDGWVGKRRTATAQIASANCCSVCGCMCVCHAVTEKPSLIGRTLLN